MRRTKASEAVGAVREVSDNFVEAIDESIKERPYTTLAHRRRPWLHFWGRVAALGRRA